MSNRWWQMPVVLGLGVVIGWGAKGATGGRDGQGNGETVAGTDGGGGKMGERVVVQRKEQFGAKAGALREELRRSTPEMLPQLVRRALEGADPAERMALVLEMFSAVDASNAAEVMAAFGEITKDSGRSHTREWLLACYLTGQRAGESMMDRCLDLGLRDNYAEAHETFFGWASADPELAEKWLEQLDGDEAGAKPELMRALLGGLAVRDPEAALKRLGELGEPERSKCMGDVTYHLVQGQGIDRAIDWMLDVDAKSGTDDREYAEKAREDILGKIFWSGSGRGGGGLVAERLELINQSVPIDGQRIVNEAGQMRGTDGLEMVDRLAAGPILSDPQLRDQAIRAALDRAMRQSPEQARNWLRDHPDSTIQSVVGDP